MFTAKDRFYAACRKIGISGNEDDIVLAILMCDLDEEVIDSAIMSGKAMTDRMYYATKRGYGCLISPTAEVKLDAYINAHPNPGLAKELQAIIDKDEEYWWDDDEDEDWFEEDPWDVDLYVH